MKDFAAIDAALRRAAKRALALARATGTPCYVWKDGRIEDIARRKGRGGMIWLKTFCPGCGKKRYVSMYAKVRERKTTCFSCKTTYLAKKETKDDSKAKGSLPPVPL